MKYSIRRARESETDRLVEISTHAFPHVGGIRDISLTFVTADFKFSDIANTIILDVDDNVISRVRVARQEILIGAASITNGFIGDVATAPGFERKGYSTRLLHRTLKDMRENGYDMAKLSGRPDFYRRFGFIELYFPCLSISASETKTAADGRYLIREEAAADVSKLAGVYESCHYRRTGMVKRDKRYWEWLASIKLNRGENPFRIVTASDRADGRLVGYAIYTAGRDFVQLENRHITTIIELAFLPEKPDVACETVAFMLKKVQENGESTLNANVQYDPAFQDILGKGGIVPKLLRGRGTGMIAILNPLSIIRKIRPVLSARVEASLEEAQTVDYSFSVSGDVFRLTVGNGKLSVEENSRARLHIPINETTLMGLVFGINTPTELGFRERFGLRKEQVEILDRIFPRQYPLFSITDCI